MYSQNIFLNVWTQFVIQTDSALAQWAQDNKFVESGLEN